MPRLKLSSALHGACSTRISRIARSHLLHAARAERFATGGRQAASVTLINPRLRLAADLDDHAGWGVRGLNGFEEDDLCANLDWLGQPASGAAGGG